MALELKNKGIRFEYRKTPNDRLTRLSHAWRLPVEPLGINDAQSISSTCYETRRLMCNKTIGFISDLFWGWEVQACFLHNVGGLRWAVDTPGQGLLSNGIR
jgi:hypothetical protein